MPVGVDPVNKKPDIFFNGELIDKIAKVKYIPPIKTKKILLTQYYIVSSGDEIYNLARQKEIDKCLLFNLENKMLDEVHILTEQIFDLSFIPKELGTKLVQINVGKRLDYKTAFDYYNKHLSSYICILSNADIFTDESLELLDYMNLDSTVLALTRYEFNDDKKTALLYGMEHRSKANIIYPDYSPTIWSQDAWVWKMNVINIENSDFRLGVYGCDNRIAHFIIKSGYNIYNPSHIISISHYDRLSSKLINGDILKGQISCIRDPVPEDHHKYKTFLINSSETLDKYTTNISLNKVDASQSKICNLDIKKTLGEIKYNKTFNTADKYIEYTFDKVYGIHIVDISGGRSSKDNYTIGYVSLFRLSYSIQGEWLDYPKNFNGIPRANGNFIKRNYLDFPCYCDKLRIHIIDFVGENVLNSRFFGDTIKDTKLGNSKLLYYSTDWQTPVITEYNIFKQMVHSNKIIPYNYFAFPWATLVDDSHLHKSNIKNLLNKYLHSQKESYFTVVQTIHYKKLFPLFNALNIKYAFASHYTIQDRDEALAYNLNIFPFPLYAVYKGTNETYIEPKKRKYLASFVGNYERYYLTNIREKIIDIFSQKTDCYIKRREKWHYYEKVYGDKKSINEINTKEYINTLNESKFSLCPSGSGPNSIRLWESLSFGTIPVILADTYILPEIKGLEWNKYVIRWEECEIEKLYDYLKTVPIEEIEAKSNLCRELYNRYFADDKQHIIIEETMHDLHTKKHT